MQISTIYQPAPQPATDYQPLPTNSSDELRVIQDSEAGTLLFKKDKQGGLVPQGGSINPGYDVVLVPKPFAFSGIAGPVQLPGSLAGQFETDLKSMEALINRLNTELGIGLAYHGQNDRTAVWSAGNCLIVTRAVDNRLTELELISFRREQSDATAGRTWKYLIDRLKGSGIPWQPIQDSERVAKKTLASFPPSRTAFKDDESFEAGKQVFEAERERRKNVTIEQAAKEILGVQLESELEDTTGWDITLMEMWNKGYSRDEIAQRVNVSKDRVTNRVTELRNKFGKERIPYDKDRKKLLIKS